MHYSSGVVETFNRALIMHKMDSIAGISGAPVLNSQNQIITINVGGGGEITVNGKSTPNVPDDYPHLNFARKIDNLALELIDISIHNKPANANTTALIPTYRLYHEGIKRHVLTSSIQERDTLVRSGWKSEGIAWHTNSKGKPVYRLYNSALQKHLYSSDTNEIQILSGRGGEMKE